MVERFLRRRLVCVLAASILAALNPPSVTHAIGNADGGVTMCDELASLPFDGQRVAEPVERVDDLEVAIAACEADLRKHPDHPRLLLQLGALVDQRKRSRWTPSAALPILQKAADRNYLAAQYFFADVMLRSWGRGLRRKGATLMLHAARAGHLEAQAQLSYHIGRMDKATRIEALALGEEAIKRGHLGAMAAVANAYLMVLSDRKNYGKAVAYLRAADEKGNHDAMALLGRFQVFPFAPNGLRDLIPENPYGGMRRMHQAAEAGNRRAAFFLGLAYAGSTNNVSGNRPMMIKWFCRAGERGRYMVAEMLERDVADYRCPEKTGKR
jgi:TPR repeat protein